VTKAYFDDLLFTNSSQRISFIDFERQLFLFCYKALKGYQMQISECVASPRIADLNLAQSAVSALQGTIFEIRREDLKIQQLLGEGQFGCTMRGEFRGKSCAVKMLKRESNSEEAETEYNCLLLELSILSKVGTHPNLVSFFGACLETPAAPLLIEELIDGPNLQEYINSKRIGFNLGQVQVLADTILHDCFQIWLKRDVDAVAHMGAPNSGSP
jgi:hypothetical protein